MSLIVFVFIAVFVFSLCLGSLGNALIYRIPRDIPMGLIKQQRSFCPQCKNKIAWYDNVPLLSYLFLKGKCRNCKNKIPIRYPLVEGLTAVLLTYSVFHALKFLEIANLELNNMYIARTLMDIYFIYTLILIIFIDIDFKIIPDRFSVGSWALTLLLAAFGVGLPFMQALIGGLVGAGSFFLIAYIFEKVRGIEGLGMGDVKMMGWLGSWLGVASLPILVVMASFSGLIVGLLAMRKSSEGMQTAIPFGPFLAMGAYIVWWLSLSSFSIL